jgi:hypothetical protein
MISGDCGFVRAAFMIQFRLRQAGTNLCRQSPILKTRRKKKAKPIGLAGEFIPLTFTPIPET